MYHQFLTFSNSKFRPHSVFMCFVWISEQTAIISVYSINWLVCITEGECLLRGTDWVFIYNSGYVWISEQTAIISLYNINWLVCITEMECIYCAVRTGSLSIIQGNVSAQLSSDTLGSWKQHSLLTDAQWRSRHGLASPRHMTGLYSVANPIWCDSAEMGLVTSHTNQDLS